MKDLETMAKEFATEKHTGQFRKNGVTPYIEHPKAVVEILKGIGVNDPEVFAAAWLHDVVEDTPVSIEHIYDKFGMNVALYVGFLTHNKKDKKDDYMKRLVISAPRQAQLVKLADVLHNCREMDDFADPEEKRKFVDGKIYQCRDYYLPLAKEISPDLFDQITEALSRNP